MEAFHQSLACASCGTILFLCTRVSSCCCLSPYRFVRGPTYNKSSGQSRERFKDPGVPGGPGQPAPGLVVEGYKSRADPACLFILHPCTPQEELEVTLNNQAMSSQPCSQHFPCTGTEAGRPTAADAGN